MLLTSAITSASLFFLCWLCLRAERKSKKWYSDRFLLSLAGFLFGLGCVAFGVAVYFVL